MDSKYSGMLKADKSAPACMPQGVVHKSYPKRSYVGGDLDDTMRKIDSDRSSSVSKMKSRKPDSKW